MSYVCECCGQRHEGLPLNIGFEFPIDYLDVPQRQRRKRCQLTTDWCIIDGSRFYVRGVLSIPLRDMAGEFTWGLWARLPASDLRWYREGLETSDGRLWRTTGVLCGAPSAYPGLEGHPLAIQFGSPGDRPTFTLKRSKHLLSREQRAGITLHRVQEILHIMYPDRY